MQTYLVSILLRTITGRVGLLFCLMMCSGLVLEASSGMPDPIEKDSLFAQWAKSKSTLPTLFYELKNFNDFSDRVEAESFIRMYGVGGIIISNGEAEEIRQWTQSNQNWRKEPLIHIASMGRIFELPFQGLPQFPSQLSVTCYTNDSLVYLLGQTHAQVLRSMGIGMVRISDLPDYFSSHELEKVHMYLQGIMAGNIVFYFGEKIDRMLVSRFADNGLSSQLIHVADVKKDGRFEKKSLRNYRKETRDKRIVFDQIRDVDYSVQQIERGVGIITISKSSKPQSLINELLLKGVPTKGFYRQQVRSYFGLLAKTERAIRLLFDPLYDWNAIQRQYLFQDMSLTQSENQLPFSRLDSVSLVTISSKKSFEMMVDRYQLANHLPATLDSLIENLPKNATVLVDATSFEKEDQMQVWSFFDSLSKTRPVVMFAESDQDFVKARDWKFALVWNPDASNSKLDIMVEMAFGARAVTGEWPGYLQSNNDRNGIQTKGNGRLVYDDFGRLDINEEVLNKIDSLVALAIREEMMPGCQIMMVKDGQVVYDKNFGYLTYDSLTPVQWDHVYDIASVTKTVATVPALMRRMDEGKMNLNGNLGDYLPNIDSTKSKLLLDDILTHQSGLKSYLPFWRHAEYFSDSASFLYKKRKYRRRYTYHAINWGDSIQSWIATSPYNSLSNNDGSYRYLYSDLGFMLMKDLVEENCKCAFDQSMDQLLYRPMGMNFTAFNPLARIPKEQIAPTEQDKYFRSELLQGIVHDKNAALLGGVSGHAGLFANANDLAKYMQMLIQGGYYGGVRYFSDSVVQVFTSKKNENDRRAMGWDKPYQSVGNASKYSSSESFGHSGFTGTLVWADPKYNLVYIFLSNRIYPDPQNYKLIESNIRTKIHDLMYESFLKVEKETNPGS